MRRFARYLMVLGVAGIVLGARATHVAIRDPSLTPINQNPFLYLIPAVILVGVALVLGLPNEPSGWYSAIGSAVVAAGTGVAAVAVVRLFDADLMPRFVLLVAGAALIPWYVVCCRIAHHGRHRSGGRERVLVVAEPDEADNLRTDCVAPSPAPEVPFTLLGTVDPQSVGPDLLSMADQRGATLLVLVGDAVQRDNVLEVAALLHRRGVKVRTNETFYDGWLGKLPVSALDQLALMTDIETLHTAHYAPVKRIFDVMLGLLGLLLLVAITPLVLLGNLLGNRGRFLYHQRRVGLNDREFTIWKLRTMRGVRGEEVPAWTTPDDPRVTPFGRVLRRTHLDELPQSINMMLGSLSAVGPRPEQPHFVRELEDKLPYYALRHFVKPGLTGWAQVKYRYAASESDALQKLQYDLYYLRHQSLVLDLRIVSRTVRQFLGATGR